MVLKALSVISNIFNREGQRSERFIMDDRGLVSSVIYFKDNMPYYQDYLNTKGIWQF